MTKRPKVIAGVARITAPRKPTKRQRIAQSRLAKAWKRTAARPADGEDVSHRSDAPASTNAPRSAHPTGMSSNRNMLGHNIIRYSQSETCVMVTE